jgi:hypothetical protein
MQWSAFRKDTGSRVPPLAWPSLLSLDVLESSRPVQSTAMGAGPLRWVHTGECIRGTPMCHTKSPHPRCNATRVSSPQKPATTTNCSGRAESAKPRNARACCNREGHALRCSRVLCAHARVEKGHQPQPRPPTHSTTYGKQLARARTAQQGQQVTVKTAHAPWPPRRAWQGLLIPYLLSHTTFLHAQSPPAASLSATSHVLITRPAAPALVPPAASSHALCTLSAC